MPKIYCLVVRVNETVRSNEYIFSILQDSMSSTYEDMGPIPWYRTEQAIFYIVFFIVFPFFFVNIFVALIIVTFNELGEAELEDDMDKNQKSCIDFAIQAKPLQLYVPSETSGIRSVPCWILIMELSRSSVAAFNCGVCVHPLPLRTSSSSSLSSTRSSSCSSSKALLSSTWTSSATLTCCSLSSSR